uniref:Uncharacterized protein n=1 Tax=Rhizophora mucronata TaxID=61149 RepID=A0A2P2JPM1_RHIMU
MEEVRPIIYLVFPWGAFYSGLLVSFDILYFFCWECILFSNFLYFSAVFGGQERMRKN